MACVWLESQAIPTSLHSLAINIGDYGIGAVVPSTLDPFGNCWWNSEMLWKGEEDGPGSAAAAGTSRGISCTSYGFPLLPPPPSSWKRPGTGERQPGGSCTALEVVAPVPAAKSREVSGCQIFPPRCFGGEFGLLPSCWGLTRSDLKSTQVYIN